MEQHQRVIFESAPAFILLCVVIALLYSTILYFKVKHPWSKLTNTLLYIGRSLLVFSLCFLLLGPIVRQIQNFFEKPVYIVVQDNSTSLKETVDSTVLNTVEQSLHATQKLLEEKGYEARLVDLNGASVESFSYESESSDLQGALKRITNQYEGKNIGGVILLSDGIYNSGLSPIYGSYNFPVHTIGVGDTTQRPDVAIKNVSYNKIAYQGNKFPLHVDVIVKNLTNQSIDVSLLQRGKVIEKQTKNSANEQLLSFDFQPLATEKGIQKLDIQIDVKTGEHNTRNNRSSVFIEVVEGRKKILVIAPAPHPDIKALREVIEKNPNYELLIHIPRVEEQQASVLQPEQIDLAIFHQAPDMGGRTRELFQRFASSKTSMWLILGQQSDLFQVSRNNMPLRVDALPRDYDDVTPAINPSFSSFTISSEANSIIPEYPPVSVHFGKIQVPATATPLLFQRVGSMTTEKALLSVDIQNARKTAIMLGEGMWRWRLNEFDRTENTLAFDEIFGKLIQYLSTTEDKRKFRSYPIQQEFSDTEPVIFESQVYNDIYEPIYGNKIDLEISNESGRKQQFSYTTGPGNIRYSIGGLSEGVYRYKARTTINQKAEEVRGEFAVVQRQAELQNLTADFDLLKKVSEQTGGKFFLASQMTSLQQELQKTEASSIIHSEENYQSLINLKWIFWLLLLLVSAEWFLRKYYGSY
jgi:hypothetical protein